MIGGGHVSHPQTLEWRLVHNIFYIVELYHNDMLAQHYEPYTPCNPWMKMLQGCHEDAS